jgi:hypothetical protein
MCYLSYDTMTAGGSRQELQSETAQIGELASWRIAELPRHAAITMTTAPRSLAGHEEIWFGVVVSCVRG